MKNFPTIPDGELFFLSNEVKEEWARLSKDEKRDACFDASLTLWDEIFRIRSARLEREKERGAS